jgi:hypothetical protein
MPAIDENELKKQASVEDELKKQASLEDELKKQASNPVGWLWTVLFKYRIGKILILCFALVSVVTLFVEGVEKIVTWSKSANTYFNSAKWPSQPAVLYIYPNGEFGLLRKNGFVRGIKTFENEPILNPEYFDPPLDKLKSGDISGIEDKLTSWLKTDTVVAVVAPSITEATRPVVELVRRINPNIPIVIESSIDPIDVNWQANGNLFRLSSGVDTRGMEIGHIIVSLVNSNRPVAIIAEEGEHSYGGKMLKYATMVSWQTDSVPTFRYAPGSLDTKLKTLFQNRTSFDQVPDEAIKKLQDSNAVVFFLGLGSDMESLLKLSFRNNSSPQAQAKIVGIMNAYKLAQLYSNEDGENRIKSHLVFEMTDFDFIAPFNPPEEAAAIFKQTFSDSKPITPVHRDQAYSYDVAMLLSDAVAASRSARSYADGLNRINTYLRTYSGRGVTGSIVLNKRKERSSTAPPIPEGQNAGSTLHLAVYHQESGKWIMTSTNIL